MFKLYSESPYNDRKASFRLGTKMGRVPVGNIHSIFIVCLTWSLTSFKQKLLSYSVPTIDTICVTLFSKESTSFALNGLSYLPGDD